MHTRETLVYCENTDNENETSRKGQLQNQDGEEAIKGQSADSDIM